MNKMHFKTIQEANAYEAFCQEGIMPRISWFLPKSTVIHFTVLSKHFNNLLNDPKSDFGKIFWKNWAVKTNNIKFFKSKNHNYKLKLVQQTIAETKRKLKEQNFNMYRFLPVCKNCNKPGKPDVYYNYIFNDTHYYCNCKIVDSDTIRDAMKKKFNLKRNYLEHRKKELIKQLEDIEVQHEEINKKENEFDKIPTFKSMLPVLEDLKKNAHYKNNRKQAERAYNEVLKLSKRNCRKRHNYNYKPKQKSKSNENKK